MRILVTPTITTVMITTIRRSSFLVVCLILSSCSGKKVRPESNEEVYSLPFRPGTHFLLQQGPFGEESHNEKGNEYSWDLSVPYGTDVTAMRDGTIYGVFTSDRGGDCDSSFAEFAHNIKVLHSDGTIAQYVHVDPSKKPGDKVSRGDVIAKTSKNGWICQPHLHVGVYRSKEHLYHSPERETIPLFFRGMPDELKEQHVYVVDGISVSQDLTIFEKEPGVFIITHRFPYPSNSSLIETKNGDLILIDTPQTPEATETLFKWMESRYGKSSNRKFGKEQRRLMVINTHYHVDSIGGNKFFLDRNYSVYGSHMTTMLIRESSEPVREMILAFLGSYDDPRFKEAHQKIPYLPPNHRFALNEPREIPFGGEKIKIIYPGQGHSLDNILVYVPSKKVLFGGCFILAGNHVGNQSDADLSSWKRGIRQIENIDASTVIPGHGSRFDPGLIENTKRVLNKYR